MKKMMMVLAVLALASTVVAQAAPQPTLFIEPSSDGFETFVSAAMFKKGVPVQVTTNPEQATHILKSTPIEVDKQSGLSKVARCLFIYCAGIQDSSNVSVTLVTQEGIVVWSYAVKKGKGSGNRQSMAESIAKHLKNDYLKVK